MHDDSFLTVRDLMMHFPVSTGGWFGRAAAFVKAVDGVSLSVQKGETFGLVGESGCGKTTLGRCVLRLLDPTSGQIKFDGLDILDCGPKEMRKLRQRMQIIFQDPYSSLDPRNTINQIIGEPIKVHKLLNGKERQERLKQLMELVGLRPEHLHRYPHEFSGGQRQRICIARTLSLNPELIIADEPVSALDVSIQAQILNLMVELQEKFGLTYIFISHDLSVVRHIADRVAVMYLGRLVESAPTGELFEHPTHPYTRALLSAVPVANPKRIGAEIILEGDIPSPLDPPAGCSFHPRCQYKQPVCTEKKPELRSMADGHMTACHFPL